MSNQGSELAGCLDCQVKMGQGTVITMISGIVQIHKIRQVVVDLCLRRALSML